MEAIDDPAGDCRPCLPLSRAPDRRWPRRPGSERADCLVAHYAGCFLPLLFPTTSAEGIRKKTPSGKCVVFFCPLRFPTTSTRRHLEKSRREKSCARVRGFADFYQRVNVATLKN